MASRLSPYNPYRQQTSSGVAFQPTYDPSFDQNMANLMMQENQKSMQALAGLQAQEAAMGDIFSYDPEGRDQRIQEFKKTTSSIRDKFGDDLALAAPALAQAVVSERANPWYQKNQLYTKEYERRQQMMDRFGPNLMVLQDLPTGNLTDINMEDIQFQALNRQHLYDIFKQNLGHLADKITNLPLSRHKDFAGILQYGRRKGLTENEALQAAQGFSGTIDAMVAESGLPDSPELRNQIRAELDQWSVNNLVGGTTLQYREDPTASGGSNDMTSMFQLPTSDFEISKADVTTIRYNPEEAKALKSSMGWKNSEPMTADDPNMPKEVAQAIEEDPEYKAILENEPLYEPDHEFLHNEVVGYSNLSPEKQQEVTDYLNRGVRTSFLPGVRFTDALGITGKGERSVVTNEILQDKFGVEFTDMGLRNFKRQQQAHNAWYRNQYRPKEKELIEKGPVSITQTSIFSPDAEASTALVSTFDDYINSGILQEFTYFDPSLKAITKNRKGSKNFEGLLEDGYDIRNISVVRGTHESPNIFQVTLQKGDGETETIRFAPNSANNDAVTEELAFIMKNPTYLYANQSKRLYEDMKNKDGKLTIADITGDNTLDSDYHIERVEEGGRRAFGIVESANPEKVVMVDNDLAKLTEMFLMNSGDQAFKAMYLSTTTAFQFFSRLVSEDLTPTERKQIATSNALRYLGPNE